jgi:hypothetical protein
VLAAGVGLGAYAATGCGDAGGGNGADAGAGVGPDATIPLLGDPEIGADLWQTMAAYVRASADGRIGTRINLFNPATVPQRVVLQVFLPTGELVARQIWDAFAPGHSWHIELGEFLPEHGVPLPFAGSLWVGATPESGLVFMGLQGITFDWYGPADLASVHGMRDFGNSNHDGMWSDLILPKVIVGARFVTKIGLLNASADGVSEALVARPEIVLRDDAGTEVVRTTLAELPPYCSRLIDVRDVLGGADLAQGSVQILEPAAGLVAVGFVVDTENDGFTNADHFFDRHFVVDSTGFIG